MNKSDVVLFDTAADDLSTAVEIKVAYSKNLFFDSKSNQVVRVAKNELKALVYGTHLVHYKLGDR